MLAWDLKLVGAAACVPLGIVICHFLAAEIKFVPIF
jgi:hypothetical protein